MGWAVVGWLMRVGVVGWVRLGMGGGWVVTGYAGWVRLRWDSYVRLG